MEHFVFEQGNEMVFDARRRHSGFSQFRKSLTGLRGVPIYAYTHSHIRDGRNDTPFLSLVI